MLEVLGIIMLVTTLTLTSAIVRGLCTEDTPVTYDPDLEVFNICLPERFDFSYRGAFNNAYTRFLNKKGRFVVDFSDTVYIDSSAIGMLCMFRDMVGGDDAQITLTNCSKATRNILLVSNMDQLFDIT